MVKGTRVNHIMNGVGPRRKHCTGLCLS